MLPKVYFAFVLLFAALILPSIKAAAVADKQGPLYKDADFTAPPGVAKGIGSCVIDSQCNTDVAHCEMGQCTCNSNCVQNGIMCYCTKPNAGFNLELNSFCVYLSVGLFFFVFLI